MYRTLPCIAVLSVALIAGCGGGGGVSSDAGGGGGVSSDGGSQGAAAGSTDATDADPNQPLDEDVKMENSIADCMKNEGFRYIPHPETYGSATEAYIGSASLVQPDGVVRKWREKYGLGVAALTIYPNDPQIAPRKTTQDPNKAIVAGLTPAKLKAYNLALMGYPSGEAPDPKSPGYVRSIAAQKKADQSCWFKAEHAKEAKFKAEQAKTKAADHKLWVRYQSDPALQAAGQKYANCLKSRGYKIRDAQPLYLVQALNPSQMGGSKTLDGGLAPASDASTMTVSQAKRALAKEVKAGVDDVDCRGPYAKIMRTKYVDIAMGKISEGGAG